MSDNASFAVEEIWDESGFLIGFAGALTRIQPSVVKDSSVDENSELVYVSNNTASPTDLKDSGVRNGQHSNP